MHSNQSDKTLSVGTSFSAAGTATSSFVDTLGYDSVSINVFSSNTHPWSTLAVQQSDTTDATNFVSISGTICGTDWTAATAYVTASGTTAASGVQFNLSSKARKRYLRVSHGGATAATSTIVASLGQAANVPSDATSYGAITLVNA